MPLIGDWLIISGPLIINGLGFDKYTSSLLNMPFGAIQWIVIILASFLMQKAKLKSVILAAFMIPVIVGLALLYVLPRTPGNEGPLLVGYYLLAFLYGGIPCIVSWIVSNTAGTTKKSILMSLYNAGASAGNIIGPLLFTKTDAPAYHPGLRSCLGVFIALIGVVGLQVANLLWLNRLQEQKRVAIGKPRKLKDHSMEARYVDFGVDNEGEAESEGSTHAGGGERLGEKAFLDLTDRKNDEFVYLY